MYPNYSWENRGNIKFTGDIIGDKRFIVFNENKKTTVILQDGYELSDEAWLGRKNLINRWKKYIEMNNSWSQFLTNYQTNSIINRINNEIKLDGEKSRIINNLTFKSYLLNTLEMCFESEHLFKSLNKSYNCEISESIVDVMAEIDGDDLKESKHYDDHYLFIIAHLKNNVMIADEHLADLLDKEENTFFDELVLRLLAISMIVILPLLVVLLLNKIS
jgi:hypothetical protein